MFPIVSVAAKVICYFLIFEKKQQERTTSNRRVNIPPFKTISSPIIMKAACRRSCNRRSCSLSHGFLAWIRYHFPVTVFFGLSNKKGFLHVLFGFDHKCFSIKYLATRVSYIYSICLVEQRHQQ